MSREDFERWYESEFDCGLHYDATEKAWKEQEKRIAELTAQNKELAEALRQASRHLDLLEPSSTICKIVSEALAKVKGE